MKAYITGLVTGVKAENAINALEAVSFMTRVECENLVHNYFLQGRSWRTKVREKAPPDDWYAFMCHFEYESWDDNPNPTTLKLFRATVGPKKNTGKNGKVNGRQAIEVVVLTLDEDEAVDYFMDHIESLGQLYTHVKREHVLCKELTGPFESGYIIYAS